ncbi:unnamed protein product [Microthlaspi erraticum]|uniref:Uncharacterized protein n=1 Tax=Microthlaspi erraticum TaxID=1685480 RepID=A0A6D2J6E9_9BRAS|nr:unnamed protein product [Microthlaspi erraticum]
MMMFRKSKKNNQEKEKEIDDIRESIETTSEIVDNLVKMEKLYVRLSVRSFIYSGRENDEVRASEFLETKALYEQLASATAEMRGVYCRAIVRLEKEIEALEIQTKAKQNWMNLILCGKLLPKQQDNTSVI